MWSFGRDIEEILKAQIGGLSFHRLHKLRVEVITQSEARFLRVKRLKSIVVGEPYKIGFSVTNIGDGDFPGGEAIIAIRWGVNQVVNGAFSIPQMKRDEVIIHDPITTHALTEGFGLVFFNVKSSDGANVKVVDPQESPRSQTGSIATIRTQTWEEIYTFWALIVSAAGLTIIAAEKVVQLIAFLGI